MLQMSSRFDLIKAVLQTFLKQSSEKL